MVAGGCIWYRSFSKKPYFIGIFKKITLVEIYLWQTPLPPICRLNKDVYHSNLATFQNYG
jgi:hypothetical protein